MFLITDRLSTRGIACSIALLSCLASTPAAGQGWTNFRLNEDGTQQLQNEEQIAINPRNPANMVAVWRDFRLGFRQVGWAYTFDGGAHWTEGGLIEEPNYEWQSDPGVTTDRDGNFYTVVLSLNSTAEEDGIFVLRSTNGGVSWGEALPVVNQVPGVFEDKEFLACDRTDSPHSGNLYVAWTRFSSVTQIVFRRSTDSGLSWENTVPVSGTGASVQFPIPVVGRQGEVYVAWGRQQTVAQIRTKRSTDGGLTFGSSTAVASVQSVFTVLNGGVDAYASPHMDADITDGPFSGRVYVAFMDQRSGFGDRDIWVASSDDQGVTWSPPVRINDDAPSNGRDQFHPWLTVDNLGIVTVAFLDRRHDPNNLTYHCYLTQSTDGGATWATNVRVSTEPSDPSFAEPHPSPDSGLLCSPGDAPLTLAGLLGEYIGVVSWNGHATPVWTDIRNFHQDVYVGFTSQGTGTVEPTLVSSSPEMVVAPNPVFSGEGVRISSSRAGGVVRIYDLAGRLRRELHDHSGEGSFRWDARGAGGAHVGPGVYFVRFLSSHGTATRKVTLVE